MPKDALKQARPVDSSGTGAADLKDGSVLALQEVRARGNMYRFLSAVYLHPPQQSLLKQVTQDAFLEELSLSFSAEAVQPLKDLATASDPERALPFLRQDYMNLFAVPSGRYVTPFEDVYRGASPECGQMMGPLLGVAAIAVKRIYREAGAEMDMECRELPTHIGVELSFMSFLCESEVMALGYGQGNGSLGGENGNMLGSSRYRELQVRFLQEHLNGWFPQLAQAIQNHAQSPFYRGLALVTEEFLAWDTAGLIKADSDPGRNPG